MIKKIEQLPENLKLKAEGYIDALLDVGIHGTTGITNDFVNINGNIKGKLKESIVGPKGFVTYTAGDFNLPLTEIPLRCTEVEKIFLVIWPRILMIHWMK